MVLCLKSSLAKRRSFSWLSFQEIFDVLVLSLLKHSVKEQSHEILLAPAVLTCSNRSQVEFFFLPKKGSKIL